MKANENADNAALVLDPPDPLETCRRLGVEPVSHEHARELIGEWTATMQAAQATKH